MITMHDLTEKEKGGEKCSQDRLVDIVVLFDCPNSFGVGQGRKNRGKGKGKKLARWVRKREQFVSGPTWKAKKSPAKGKSRARKAQVLLLPPHILGGKKIIYPIRTGKRGKKRKGKNLKRREYNSAQRGG